MFRKRQSLELYPSYVIVETEETLNESGEYVHQATEQNKNLPDSEMFDLGNIIASGKMPEEVDSRLFSSASVDADSVVRKYTQKESNKKNEGDN